MRGNEREFHLKEYDSVRAEVSTLLARIETLFKYSVVASASVFAWLMTNTFGTTNGGTLCVRAPSEILRLAWGIPAGFIYLSAAVAAFNYFRVRHLGDYLRQLETSLGSSTLGWQKFDGKSGHWLTISTVLVWLLLVITATYAGHLGRKAIEGAQSSSTPVAAKNASAPTIAGSGNFASATATQGVIRTQSTEQLCPKN